MVLHAARQPLAILVLVAALFTGLTVALWMLPLGVLVYAVVVFLAARDPATAQTAQRQAITAARPRITSSTFRKLLEEIERSHSEIARTVAQTGGPLANLLRSIEQQSAGVIEQAHTLADKGQIIEQFLAQINQRQLQDQLAKLDAQIARTQDPYTKQQLEETRKAIIERQTNARDLQTYYDRVVAQLQNIDANLNNVLAEMVRLRAADVVSANSASNDVADRLRDLNTDMDAFQRVLDTALAGQQGR